MDRDFDLAYEAYLDATKAEEKLAEYHLACERCAQARARMTRMYRIRFNRA